jgi:hypothetical protein
MSRSRRKSSRRIAVSSPRKPQTPVQHWSRFPGRFLREALFFTFFCLYLRLYVDLRLIYHGAGMITNFPVFYKGRSFFLPFLSYPGGPVEYLSAFLSQLFYISWAGAFVVTVQAWLICLCIDHIFKAANLRRIRGIRFLLPILSLILYTQYTYHFLATLAFLAALLAVCIYLKVALSRTDIFSCVGVFLILSVMVYYLAGGAFLLFAAICAIYELMFRFRWKVSLFYCFCAAAIPYVVGLLIFQVSIVDAFCNSLPFSWRILRYEVRRRGVTVVYLSYLFLPLTLLVSGLLRICWQHIGLVTGRSAEKTRNKSAHLLLRIFSSYGHAPRLRWVVESLLLLVIGCTAISFSRNENLRTRFKVDYYAYHKMWPELLASAQQYPHDPFVAHAVNRALYHVGRLGYDMFSWPQQPDYLFLSDEKYKWMYWQIFDVFLDLGVVNMAENALTECLEGLGSRPMILQRLALINMVKGNLDSAKIYLGALSKTLFDADWAKRYLDRLRIDPDLSGDRDIQHLRSICLDKDCPIYALFKERTLLWLLEKNPRNRMAFEYLMAWHMLNKNLSKLTQKMELLQDFGYAELPTHYEQAALIYAVKTKTRFVPSGYSLNPQVRRQFEEFSRILKAYGGNKQAAFNSLSRELRNTYFFYNVYAPSGTNR